MNRISRQRLAVHRYCSWIRLGDEGPGIIPMSLYRVAFGRLAWGQLAPVFVGTRLADMIEEGVYHP